MQQSLSCRLHFHQRKERSPMKKQHWYDHLWIWTILYFALGFFNILFAWLGMIDFLVPLFIAILGGNKAFCNRYCGRGQLLAQCGKCSRNAVAPKWLSSKLIWLLPVQTASGKPSSCCGCSAFLGAGPTLPVQLPIGLPNLASASIA